MQGINPQQATGATGATGATHKGGMAAGGPGAAHHHAHEPFPLPNDPEACVRLLMEKCYSMSCGIEEAHRIIKSALAPGAIISGVFPGQMDMNMEAFRAHFDSVKHAMPDVNCVCYDMATTTGAEGKPVVFTRFVKLGRFSGQTPLYGFTPTHGKVEERGVAVWRFTKEQPPRVEYAEIYSDHLAMLESLGLNMYTKLPKTATSLHNAPSIFEGQPGPSASMRGSAAGATMGTAAGIAHAVAGTASGAMGAVEETAAHMKQRVEDAVESVRIQLESLRPHAEHIMEQVRGKLTQMSGGAGTGTTGGTTAASRTK